MFFFNDTATTEIYTLSLHDALPIYTKQETRCSARSRTACATRPGPTICSAGPAATSSSSCSPTSSRRRSRSEEHTSELQSRQYLVCRLLLEKKNILILALLLRSFLM